MTLNGSRVFLGCLAVLALAACSSGSQGVASKYVATGNVGPTGGTIPVTASDDATLAGTTIVIPANALTKETTISIGLSTEAVTQAHTTKAGPVVDFEPSGLVFAVPATVTIPVSVSSGTSASSIFIEAIEDDLSTKQIAVQSITHGLATFQVSGFTRFGALIRSASTGCTTNADCTSPEVCVDGVCAATTPADAGVDATTCAAGETVCADKCVDVATDSANCGACGRVCPTGETCAGGACATTTPTGCSTNTDCPSGEVCVANTCVLCGGTNANCTTGADCCSGICGASNLCAGAAVDAAVGCTTNAECPSGEECVDNACASPVDAGPDATDAMACTGGMTLCAGVCVDLTSDPANCGMCGDACDVRSTCVGGTCVAGIDAGTDAALGCSTSAECATGEVCVGYVCVAGSDAGTDAADAMACAANFTDCSGVCVNLATDPDNCGGCGMVCATGQTCIRAACS